MDYLRKKYRILLITIILIVGMVISTIIYVGLKDVDDMYHNYAAKSIMDIKKAYLKDTVNNIIAGIKQKNDDQVNFYYHIAEDITNILDNYYHLDSEGFYNYTKQYMTQEIKKLTYFFYCRSTVTADTIYEYTK